MSDPEDDSDVLEEIKALENVLANKEPACSPFVETRVVSSGDVADSHPTNIPSRGFGEVEPRSDDVDPDDSSESLTAYETNKKLIESLREARRELLAILEQCLENKAIVDEKIRTRANSAKSTKILICSAGMPYFKDSQHFSAPYNNDVEIKMKNDELQVVNLHSASIWTPKDRNTLWLAVRHEAVNAFFKREGLNDGRSSQATVESGDGSEANDEEISSAERSRDASASPLNLPKNYRAMVGPLGAMEFDWLKIAASDFDERHTADECRVMWNILLHPDINRCGWSKKEDSKLITLVAKYDAQNWDKIAEDLASNRSGYQCFIRYNNVIDRNTKNETTWSKMEDDKLRRCVEKLKIGHYIPWGTVTRYMEGKSKGQVYYHWMYHIAPHLKKGRFTDDEDTKLIEAVAKYGKNFCKISNCVITNRSSVQLSEHYQTLSMRKRGIRNSWSVKEDARLLVNYNLCGADWSKIARKIPGKTRTQVRHRYNSIMRYWDRGVSLYEIPRDYRTSCLDLVEDNEEEIDEIEDVDLINRLERDRSKNLNEMELVDLDIVKYFQHLPAPSRPGRKRKYYGKEELEERTKKLSAILHCLGANLVIPDEFDNTDLTEKDKQLLKSLKDYQESWCERMKVPFRDRRCSRNDETRHFALLCTGNCNANLKIRWHDNINCESSSNDDNRRITLNHDFDTPKMIVDIIGDEKNDQFHKLSNIMICRKIQQSTSKIRRKVYVLGPEETAKMLSSVSAKSLPGQLRNIVQTNTVTSDKKKSSKKKVSSCTLSVNDEIIQCLDQSIGHVEPHYCTLLALKNISSKLKTSRETNHRTETSGPSEEGKKSMATFEKRLVQLFKYPIGLSHITPSNICVKNKPQRTESESRFSDDSAEDIAETSSTSSSPPAKKRRN